MTDEVLPTGRVAFRGGEEVQATDGSIGRVPDLVVDLRQHQTTHLVVQEGHLWGRRQVAVPVSVVALLDEDGGVHLRISTQAVEALDSGR